VKVVVTSPQDNANSAERDDPSPIDWVDLKDRIREAIRAVLQERADELGLSWNDYLDRLQEESDDPPSQKSPPRNN
jgi:hypothetical protein